MPTFAQQQDSTAPPESEQAKQIVALVEKASTLIDSEGKSIFSEFRKTGTYVKAVNIGGTPGLVGAGFYPP